MREVLLDADYLRDQLSTASLARKHRCGTIALEKGLGKLRSSGKIRSLNRLFNYWARSVLVALLTRRARLAGVEMLEV